MGDARCQCRVLVIASFPESLVGVRRALLESIIDSGHSVEVAAPDMPQGSAIREQLESMGIAVHNVRMRRAGINVIQDAKTLMDLRALCRRVAPTHVLAYTVKPVVYGLWAARMAGVPHRFALITGLGYAFAHQADWRRRLLGHLVRQLYANALRDCARVFFQNPDDEHLFRRLGLLADTTPSTVVNGSGVDTVEFAVAPYPSSTRFLLIARLLGDKGVREYVEAARRVKATHAGVSFGLVGWIDDTRDAIRQSELDEWIGEGIVDYLGRLDDVRPAISDCSVYVLPSYREGTPRSVLEAMSMGRPVITTDTPGCRETTAEGVNGYLVPAGSVSDLVIAMERFIHQRDLVASMGARSREIAIEKYDINKVNTAMLSGMGL